MQFIKVTLDILRKLGGYLLSFLSIIWNVFLEVTDFVSELIVTVVCTLFVFLLGLLYYIAEFQQFVVDLTITLIRIILQFLS